MVGVGVHVEQPGARARQRRADRLDRPAVSSLGEVRHRLERQHVAYPRTAVKAYYHARAREYDDWWLGHNLYADKHRPGWDEERAELERWIADLPPKRTLDVACGTGFMTRRLRGDVTGLDQSDAMLDVAREQVPAATFVQGDALDLPFEDGAFERVFSSYFYCHLEEDDRLRFLAEAGASRRELVIVGSRAPAGRGARALGRARPQRRHALAGLQARLRSGRAARGRSSAAARRCTRALVRRSSLAA